MDKIISSSLHGHIVSDSYGIPNKWVKFDDNIKGDYTKFYDYFHSVKRSDMLSIKCVNYKVNINILDKINECNVKINTDNIYKNMFFDNDGIKNYTKYLV